MAQRLYGRHVIGKRYDQEAEPKKGRGHREKCQYGRSRTIGERRAKNSPRQGDLNQDGRGDNQQSRQHRAENQPQSRNRQQAVAPPDPLFAFGHQRRRKSKTGATEYRDSRELAHLG